jgi:choline transport protein
MAVCAQVCYLEGTIIQGLIILNDDGYIPQKYHGTLLAWAILALPLFCNIFARRVLAPLEVMGGILHIALFVVFIVVLVVFSPRSSADFVFATTITGQSGWSNSGVEWCVGLLSGAFPLAGKSQLPCLPNKASLLTTYTAFDGVLHMS